MEDAIWQACKVSWDAITLKTNHAMVFMDSQIAEVLHWSGGINLLLSGGAQDIRNFSSFESGKESQKKAVFIVSSPIEGVTRQVVKDIVTQSHFQYVVIFTTACTFLHADTLPGDPETGEIFEDLQEEILQWMGNMNYTAEVFHAKMFGCQLSPSIFITPAFSSMFPLLVSDLRQVSYQHNKSISGKESVSFDSMSDVEFSHVPKALQTQIRLLAVGFHSLFQQYTLKEDIYSMGHLSRLVASELDSYPPAKSRRKTSQKRASLLLVDRTLDLASAVSHQMDLLMDRVANTLPNLPGHTNDRLVDFSNLSHAARPASGQATVVLPGQMATSTHTQPPSHMSSLFAKRQKEALMDINRALVETAAVEKLPLDLSKKLGRITAEQLDSTLRLFKGKQALIRKHLDVLQVALATSQTLKHPKSSSHDRIFAKEKNIIQTIADQEEEVESPGVFALMSKILTQEMETEKESRNLGLDEFVGLLAYLYAIYEEHSEEEEDEVALLQEKLVKWIIAEGDSLPPLIQQQVGDQVNETILRDQVEALWEKLEAVGQARDGLAQFGSVLDPGDTMTPASVKPLLRQLIEKIVDPAKPELTDVECKSGGLKDLLKSGFGFFKGSSKPRPGDTPLLIFFVIGGITASEVKQVKEVVEKAKPGFEILIGSTRLCSVEPTLQSLFIQDNFNLSV